MGFVASYLLNLVDLACGRQPGRPLMASWYATRRCPRRCPHCSDGAGAPFAANPGRELDTAAAQRLITVLARDLDTLDITGGEPLLRPDLGALLAHARACRLRTVLNTRSDALAERPEVLAACDIVVLGLDALDPAAAGAACGQDAAAGARLLATLDRLHALQAVHRFRLMVSAVARPGRLGETLGVLERCARLGIGFHCSPQLVGTVVHPALAGDPAWPALAELIRRRRRRGQRIPGVDAWHRGVRDLAPYRCHPQLMPTIAPDGRLHHPCLELGAPAVDVVAAGGLRAALRQAGRGTSERRCRRSCQIFCHGALSQLQRRPLQALDELLRWDAA
jgi:MoaA/NifB/PqqE/SkfB family radical SAM enzyme